MIRVMLVTKHTAVREDLSMVLRLTGSIEVTGFASSLPGAVHLAADARPDAALIDLEMPEGEGYVMIRQMKALYPCLRIIALTAHDYPAARESAFQAGASRVMLKGLDVAEMLSEIQAAVTDKDPLT